MSLQDMEGAETKKGFAIAELQNLKTLIVTGGADGADLTATGLKTSDTLQSVLRYVAGVPTSNLLSTSEITEEDVLVVTGTNTTGDVLVVQYWEKPAGAIY